MDRTEADLGPQPDSKPSANSLVSLLARCDAANKALDTYVALASMVTRERHIDAARRLTGKPSPTAALKSAWIALLEAVDSLDLEDVIHTQARQERLHYREQLESALASAELTFTGGWPDYVVGDVFRLKFDLQKGIASVDGKKLSTVAIGGVVEEMKARHAEFLARPFDRARFLGELTAAYDATVALQGRGFGEYVDVRVLASALRKRKAELSETQYSDTDFALDLYRLNLSRVAGDQGVLEFSPAQNAAGGLYIPARGFGNYVAALRFEREASP